MRVQLHLIAVAGITLSLLQNSTPVTAQNRPSAKPEANSAPPESKAAAEATSVVAAIQPVITVRGICDEGAVKTANANSCTTVLTREQFEALMKALSAGGQTLPGNARKSLAKTYAEYLAVEAAARKAGMEDTLEFRELMTWTRLRTITELYRRSLQEKYSTPSEEEIGAYYQQHLAEFQRVKLVRILIPRESSSATNKDEFAKKAREAAHTARNSLVKGLDPTQVQKDAYTVLGLAAPPATDLGNRRQADLIPEEAAEVFSLKLGEVSQVEAEPQNYVIYKVVGKDAIPEEQVKKDIAREIYQRKFKDAMKAILDAAPAEYDEQYLGSDKATPPATSH